MTNHRDSDVLGRYTAPDSAAAVGGELYPHVPAAFINAIAEEGSKGEAVLYLQRQWNETCALRTALRSIANNTCCGGCLEAARVARDALNPRPITSTALGGNSA